MRKCKICGEPFQYHVSNAHLETHGVTRKEYNEMKEKEFRFDCSASMSQNESDVNNYIINSFVKTKKKYNLK